MKIEIVEYESGEFQVFRNNRSEVLQPSTNEWNPGLYKNLSFMFFPTREYAEESISIVAARENEVSSDFIDTNSL